MQRSPLFSYNHPASRDPWTLATSPKADCVEIWNSVDDFNHNFEASFKFWDDLLLRFGKRITAVGGSDMRACAAARRPAVEEPQATLCCRCPLSLAVRLRTLAFERSKGKMVFIMTAIVSLLITTANAQTACNTYTSGSTPPQGFGASWNVLTTNKELLLESICQASSVTFKAGNGAQNRYIYKKGYYFTTSWQAFDFQGIPAQGTSDWLAGQGSYTFNTLPTNTQYWVAYVCQWDATSNKWKCGCSDACAQSLWQLQGTKPSGSGGGGGLHQPADPQLIPQGKRLLDWLYTLPGKSDNKVISGQYHYSDAAAIQNETGKWVGIMGDTLLDGAQSAWPSGGSGTGMRQQYLDWWNAGGIILETMKFHNPKTKGILNDHDFTDADMDAIVTPGTAINTNFNQWLDAFAQVDQMLDDQSVPILVRPFHEMNCCFWYQNKDAQNMKALWKYTFDYLTKTKGLHNLLFVYSVAEFKHNPTLYYPGNEYVDIVGIDLYKDLSGSNQLTADNFADFKSMQGYGKPFALTEFGPHPANAGQTTAMADYRKLMTAIKSYAPETIFWYPWSVSWSMKASENTNVPELLNDPWTINRDEIPNVKE